MRIWFVFGLLLGMSSAFATVQPRVAIYRHSQSMWAKDLPGQLEKGLGDTCRVTVLNDQQISDANELSRNRFDMLVLCDARTLPAVAIKQVADFVHTGGDIVALGGPAFSNPLWRKDDRWISKSAYLGILPQLAASTPLNLSSPKDWNYLSGQPQAASKIQTVLDESQSTLRMDFVHYVDWDSFKSPEVSVPAGNELTYFRARGSADTPQLAVEWDEKDGSRWIAVVALTARWQNYVLPPAAFHYWGGGTNRGGDGDQLHMDSANAISFGLSHSHTVCVRDGDHTVWIENVGTSPIPKDVAKTLPLLLEPEKEPDLELLSPYYKVYPVSNLDHLQADPNQAIAPKIGGSIPKPAQVYACFARPQGTG
ncbi:MAG TPA: hypothetical protein VG722_02540, partial [Tepidisphaeraceae bacterium]|nr:hypothetical protein [Tepidisphaeraceae bacterium]